MGQLLGLSPFATAPGIDSSSSGPNGQLSESEGTVERKQVWAWSSPRLVLLLNYGLRSPLQLTARIHHNRDVFIGRPKDMRLRFIGASIVALLATTIGAAAYRSAPSVSAQEAAQPVFSTISELVVLHVVVKDRKGAYVSGLPADAFTVLEDGHRRTIQFFGKQDAPVTVGLLIDNSGSMLPVRGRVIAAPARSWIRAIQLMKSSPWCSMKPCAPPSPTTRRLRTIRRSSVRP